MQHLVLTWTCGLSSYTFPLFSGEAASTSEQLQARLEMEREKFLSIRAMLPSDVCKRASVISQEAESAVAELQSVQSTLSDSGLKSGPTLR